MRLLVILDCIALNGRMTN